jgi:hypothetical protein
VAPSRAHWSIGHRLGRPPTYETPKKKKGREVKENRGRARDLHDKLIEMGGWTVTDKEKENDLT